MSKVTLSSGREVDVSGDAGAQVTTSAGTVQTSVRGDVPRGNQLFAYINGGSVKAAQKAAPTSGRLSNLWNPFVSPSRDWTRAGVLGSHVGAVLCALGYIEIAWNGGTIEPGTPEQDLPTPEMLHAVNPPFQAVKPLPSFLEFTQLLKAMREQQKKQA